MRDVVIIGGGLTGLAAAHELQQHGLRCTLIEVKKRLGGSIHTVRVGNFVFDSGMMCHTLTDAAWFTAYLESIGLDDAIIPISDDQFAFRNGTGALVGTLANTLTMPVMSRMAVSSVGQMDGGRFSICMENGMVLDASALLIAAPARYAERILYPLVPEASLTLLDYPYESITRVSLGYGGKVPEVDTALSIQRLSHPSRGGTILQVSLSDGVPNDAAGELAAQIGLSTPPDAYHIALWRESDPVRWRVPQHAATLRQIMSHLPAGVALAGSDYIPTNAPPRLDERVRQGIDAVAHVMAVL